MKLAAIVLSTLGAASAFAPTSKTTSTTSLNSGKDDLVSFSNELNPIVNYFDPMSLADGSFWGATNDATIGFLRHAEIKHGRVAMAAFVGYCVQSNIHFPWKMSELFIEHRDKCSFLSFLTLILFFFNSPCRR